MKKFLFVCTENRLRSPTAEFAFSNYPNIEAIGAGTNNDAECPLSGDLIEWADIIFAMEKKHKRKISIKYTPLLKYKKLVCLDIPDNYEYMQSSLVELLRKAVSKHVRLPSADT